MEDHLNIINESGDKKYFTIVPNYILNHSSANDQSLYLQMKRLANDGEICYASKKYFIDKLKIGRKALHNSLNYLLEHKWIELAGEKEVETKGGKQIIECYKIIDLWELNLNYYKGGLKEHTLKGCLKEHKGVSERTQRGVLLNTKEEQRKKNKELIATPKVVSDSERKKIDPNTPTSLEDFIHACSTSPQRHIQIIGNWANTIKPDFKTYGQWQVFLKRYLRDAKNLMPFPDEKIIEAYGRALEATYIDKRTLGTVLKFLV